MRILGIDPGSNAMGIGLVERRGSEVIHRFHATLRPPRGATPARLAYLHAGVVAVCEEHRPDVAAVERVFLASNPRSALVLGQARGAVLAALGAAGVAVHEVAAREIKKAVVGTGAATKVQVQEMVQRLLSLAARPPTDAADALAAAIYLAHAGPLAATQAVSRGAARGRGGRRAATAIAARRGL